MQSFQKDKGSLAKFGLLILQYEWLILALLLPFVLFPTPQRAWVLLLIPLLWILRKGLTGRFFTATPINWQIFGLWLMMIVSLYATFDFAHSLEKIAGLIYATAVFFALVAWIGHSEKRLWLGVCLLVLAGSAVAALALLIVRMPPEFPALQPVVNLLPQRIWTIPGRQSTVNPNEIAGTLLWSLPLGSVLLIALLIKPRLGRGGKRPWLGPLLILLLAGMTLLMSLVLLLSQSRAALLGFLASLFFVGLIALANKSRAALIACLIVVLLLSGAFIAFADASQIAGILFPQVGLETDTAVPGLESRLEVWQRATLAIQDFPFTGMGMNNFRIVAPELYPFFIFNGESDFGHAHNQWLQTGLDLGVPGLVTYAALWLGLVLMLWHAWQQTTLYWQRALNLGLTAVVAAYFVFGWIDTIALGARPGFLWWFVLGLITSLHAHTAGAAGGGNDSLVENR